LTSQPFLNYNARVLTENVALALGLSRSAAALRRRAEAPLCASHGIGFTDFIIMSELSTVQGGRLRSVDLARRLMLSPSGITRALLGMQDRGLVDRVAHERDARAGYVALTSAGRERLVQAMPTVDRIVRETFGTITRTDRIALLGLFERLGY
jgi:DNA-binding MarR family transcriptional regulator